MQYAYKHIMIGAMLTLCSCAKFEDVGLPKNEITGTQVFSNDQSALSGLSGLYANMMKDNNSFINGNLTLFPGLLADELHRTYRSETYDAFENNALNSNNDIIGSMWSNAYSYIYQCNALLEGLHQSDNVSLSTKNQITGEVAVVRAWIYFYLQALYGDVPLVVSTDYNVNSKSGSSSQADILSQVEADLIYASKTLPEAYPVTAAFPTERIRPNKFAAVALLARIYLYERRYAEAAEEASLVINSNQYVLSDDLDEVFSAQSQEAIWQLYPVNPYTNTSDGNNFVPFDFFDPPIFQLPTHLVQSFEDNDKRKEFWTKSIVVSNQSYTIPYKYKIGFKSPADPPTEFLTLIRLAEMYLIRAESNAMTNNPNGARQDLNLVRNRAGLADITTNEAAALAIAIQHERQVELFVEFGQRWLDLKRTKTATTILAQYKGANWQPTDTLLPIPLYELKSNPSLHQNPGY